MAINTSFIAVIVIFISVVIIYILYINTKKNIKLQGTLSKYIKICLNCGSSDVHVDFSVPAVNWALGLPANYVCGKCGFFGNSFPEVETKKRTKISRKLVKKSFANAPKVDVSFGKGYMGFAAKIFGPFDIILGLAFLFMAISEKSSIELFFAFLLLGVGIFLTYFGFKKK